MFKSADLNVKIEDNLYLNLDTGEIKKEVNKSIPLVISIATRKMKPSLKYAKKAGDIWVGSNKMSFLLVFAYALLKKGKNRVIGFYKHGNTCIYIEGLVDIHKHVSMRYGFLSPDETPETFMTVEGKVYNAIFGNTHLKNIDLNLKGAYKELTQRVNPVHILIILVCFVVTGHLANELFFKEPIQIKPPPILVKEPPPPPPLTTAEADRFSLALKDKFIEKYAQVQVGVEKDASKWLRNAQVRTIKETHSVSTDVNFTYASFYPYVNHRKEGNEYIWSNPHGEKLGREELGGYSSYGAETSSYHCLKYLINYEVAERMSDRWIVQLQEKKHDRIVFLLNLIQKCPCLIRELAIDKNGMSATLELLTGGY